MMRETEVSLYLDETTTTLGTRSQNVTMQEDTKKTAWAKSKAKKLLYGDLLSGDIPLGICHVPLQELSN